MRPSPPTPAMRPPTRALHVGQAPLQRQAAHRLAVEGSQAAARGRGLGVRPARGAGVGACRRRPVRTSGASASRGSTRRPGAHHQEQKAKAAIQRLRSARQRLLRWLSSALGLACTIAHKQWGWEEASGSRRLLSWLSSALGLACRRRRTRCWLRRSTLGMLRSRQRPSAPANFNSPRPQSLAAACAAAVAGARCPGTPRRSATAATVAGGRRKRVGQLRSGTWSQRRDMPDAGSGRQHQQRASLSTQRSGDAP